MNHVRTNARLTCVDTLNSPGGKIVVLFTLIVLGLIAAAFNVPYSREIVAGSFGGLLGILGTK